MKYLSFLTVAAVAVVTFACGSAKRPAADQAGAQPGKILVLYYSQTGVTDKVARELARQTGADMERIEAVTPYAGTYEETIARCKEEMEQGLVPDIRPLQSAVEDYDVIFLGYPVWFGTYARPVMRLVQRYGFAGKTVVPFATFGSGGLQASTDSLRQALPQADVKAGFGIREVHSDQAASRINRFLIENGYVAGEVEALAAYSEQTPITPEQTAIFNEACAGYKYPLGTPVSAGWRETAESIDYRFVADNGRGGTSVIFITVPKGGNGQAEFTEVVR